MERPLTYSFDPAIEAACHEIYGEIVATYLANPTTQELSANYDEATGRCRLYYDDGSGPNEKLISGETIAPNAIIAVTLMLATKAGKSLNAEAAFLNCTLANGNRYHAHFPKVIFGPEGPSVSFRTHHRRDWKLLSFMTEEQADVIQAAIRARKTILVAGATNAGKTSLLNAIINLIPIEERLLVIEDELELHIRDGNVVRRRAVEAANLKRQVFESLRDRPDIIIVGEVRSVEAADMLEALVTGHAGGLSTIHAKGTEEAITRLMRLADCDRDHIREAIDIIVFLKRMDDGSRKVMEIRPLS
jgi:pilus assembly protein CpaF